MTNKKRSVVIGDTRDKEMNFQTIEISKNRLILLLDGAEINQNNWRAIKGMIETFFDKGKIVQKEKNVIKLAKK